MKAVVCPICKGIKSDEKCFGCGGKGWVTVSENDRVSNMLGIPPVVQGLLIAEILRAMGFRGFWR